MSQPIQPIELSIEQQFNICSFKTQVQQMSHEQAQDFLIKGKEVKT